MDQRNFIILILPISPTEPITHPEKIVVQFPNNRTLDIGALCYLKRKQPNGLGLNVRTKKKVRCRPVDLSSFSPQRVKHVEKLVRYLSEQISVSGKRLETVRNAIGRFIPFMDWADQNNHTKVLDGVEYAKASINDYLQHLFERVRLEEIAFSSAISQQKAVISVLRDHLNVENFSHGLPLLKNYLSQKNPTSPPDEKRSSDALSLSERLFDNIFCFVWNFKKYPYPIVVPEHYKYPKNTLWIFPANSWFKPASKPMSHKNGAYNYSEGKLYTLKEMIANSPNTHKSKLSESIRKAQEALTCANADQHNTHRLLLAQLALHCFVIMFQAETGMNWSQLVNLPWIGEYDSVSERQLFRVIKWRANNKEVYFEVTSKFLPKFKNFLKLREYLLRDIEFSFLFFKLNIEKNQIHSPTQLAEHQVSTYITLKRIHPDLCCHLTRVKTELHFRQVLGRILRIGEEPGESYLYLPAEPNLVEYASRVVEEIPESARIKRETMADEGQPTIISTSTNTNDRIQDKVDISLGDFPIQSAKGQITEKLPVNVSMLAQSYDMTVNMFGRFRQEVLQLHHLYAPPTRHTL